MLPVNNCFTPTKNLKLRKYVRIVFKMCALFGVPSPLNKNKFYKVYIVFLLAVSIISWIYSIYGKFKFILPSLNVYLFIIDQIASFFLCLASVAVLISSNLVNPYQLKDILYSFKTFDKLTGYVSCKGKYPLFLFANIMIAVTFTLDAWVWITYLGINIYHLFLLRNWQYYQLSLTMIIWLYIAVEVKYRFKFINNSLEGLVSSRFILQRAYTNFKTKDLVDIKGKLKMAASMYTGLCDTVDLVNSIFGCCFLYFVIFTIPYVLEWIMIIIVFVIYPPNNSKQATLVIYSSVVWILENFIKIMALASAGEHLSKEANKTITICYGIINSLENNPQYNVESVKEELKFLIQQAVHRQPCLLASGFFVANSTMMGFIIGSITSYVIVAVQFLKETSDQPAHL